MLWLLARHLDWEATVVGPATGPLWPPLAGTDFARSTIRKTDIGAGELLELARSVDLLVAVKPWPASFGAGIGLKKETDRPLMLDLDEDDPAALVGRDANLLDRVLQLGNLTIKGRRPLGLLRLRDQIPSVPRTVGNPILQERFGGDLVPHARLDPGPGAEHHRSNPVTAFVGTVRRPSRVAPLRRAVSVVADRGHRLVVTSIAPPDPQPWETWLGNTSLPEGLRTVAEADIVVCLSRTDRYGPSQMPVKIVDAMLAGRAIIATDTPPIRWALADTGVLVPGDDPSAISHALRRLEDPVKRRELGAGARARALKLFTVPAVATSFEAAAGRAAARG